MKQQRVVIIGGGFGGLAAACLLGKAGYHVTVLEKNEQLGGRAGLLKADGFTFDTGPSWYLMPDVFEHFFTLMGENITDHLKLTQLSPAYRVFYKDTNQHLDITSNIDKDAATFEAIEPGAGQQLKRYLSRAGYAYNVSMDRFLYKNYDRLSDFMTPEVLRAAPKLSLFSTMDRYVGRFFKDPRLQKIVQYPLVFLGASPYNAPSLYSLMSHTDFSQGVFYPMGGMSQLVTSLVRIGTKHGVQYQTHATVEQITTIGRQVSGVMVNGKPLAADVIISDADPWHTETALLPANLRDHSDRYWRTRTLAPSALLLYLGVNKQYSSIVHHNLLFSDDWRKNFAELASPQHFPGDPSLYVCAPSKTDPSVAPKGHENLFVLVPVAAGLQYSQNELHTFSERVLETIEQEMQLPGLRKHLIYQKSFCVDDFAKTFNSLRGTGLGLSHTFTQTAIFRPSNKSKKVRGLYYVGANVNPGIGLPTTLISAELAYKRITNDRSSGPLISL
ncbi:MAG TPA: phytoene desaturase family protein [Candidatus Saccharimonadales bacterium]|nr:phytoene desaturase family protein [Candidatus Saccharimonadales bacterium]